MTTAMIGATITTTAAMTSATGVVIGKKTPGMAEPQPTSGQCHQHCQARGQA
jgi:hypothetical protein